VAYVPWPAAPVALRNESVITLSPLIIGIFGSTARSFRTKAAVSPDQPPK
jgi:hypothetical protein